MENGLKSNPLDKHNPPLRPVGNSATNSFRELASSSPVPNRSASVRALITKGFPQYAELSDPLTFSTVFDWVEFLRCVNEILGCLSRSHPPQNGFDRGHTS